MPKLEMSHPTGFIQVELQKAIDLVSFGLQVANSHQVDTLAIPGSRFQLLPARNKAMDVKEARTAFQNWILGNGIRDCIDAVGPSLEWARKICFIWTRQGDVSVNENGSLHLSTQITGDEWNKFVLKEGKKFDYLPLIDKLEFLNKKYNLTIPEVSDSILSINHARNCLTHRQGKVGIEDVQDNSQNRLVIHWKKFQFTASGKSGSYILELPTKTKEDVQISLGYTSISKEFYLGDSIQFSPEEFSQIATTFLLFSLQIYNSIIALQSSRKPI